MTEYTADSESGVGAQQEPPSIANRMVAHAQANGVGVADAYTVTTVVPNADKPPETNTYTMPVCDLDEFFYGYAQTAEVVVDVRPEKGDE